MSYIKKITGALLSGFILALPLPVFSAWSQWPISGYNQPNAAFNRNGALFFQNEHANGEDFNWLSNLQILARNNALRGIGLNHQAVPLHITEILLYQNNGGEDINQRHVTWGANSANGDFSGFPRYAYYGSTGTWRILGEVQPLSWDQSRFVYAGYVRSPRYSQSEFFSSIIPTHIQWYQAQMQNYSNNSWQYRYLEQCLRDAQAVQAANNNPAIDAWNDFQTAPSSSGSSAPGNSTGGTADHDEL